MDATFRMELEWIDSNQSNKHKVIGYDEKTPKLYTRFFQ